MPKRTSNACRQIPNNQSGKRNHQSGGPSHSAAAPYSPHVAPARHPPRPVLPPAPTGAARGGCADRYRYCGITGKLLSRDIAVRSCRQTSPGELLAVPHGPADVATRASQNRRSRRRNRHRHRRHRGQGQRGVATSGQRSWLESFGSQAVGLRDNSKLTSQIRCNGVVPFR